MTNLRAKAREIKAEGEAERGNFTPSGAPKRIYQRWLNNSNSKKAKAIRYGDRKENFCHFWRVVLIWAPLRAIGRFLERLLPVILVAAALFILALGVWAVIQEPAILWQLPLLVVIGAYILLTLFGLICGVEWAVGTEVMENADLSTGGAWRWVRWVTLTPVIVFLLINAGALIGRALEGKGSTVAKVLATLAAVAALVFAYAVNGVVGVGVLLGLVAAIAVGAFVLGFVGGVLADYISGLRARREVATAEAWEEFYEKHGRYPDETETRKPPGKVKRFFTGVADFVVFLAQIVRVKKWKICPVVDVETAE